MKLCKFQYSAVCSDIKYRTIFESIFEKRCPDIYICPNVYYKVLSSNGVIFLQNNLNNIQKRNKGYYLIDKYTGMPIYLLKDNFQILCKAEDNCNCPNAYTRVFEFEST